MCPNDYLPNSYCACGFHVLVVREFCEQVSNYEPFKQDSVVLSLSKLHSLLAATQKKKKRKKKATLNRELEEG
jgi:hypothetical protein